MEGRREGGGGGEGTPNISTDATSAAICCVQSYFQKEF